MTNELTTAEALWALAWPDVPWYEASPEDQELFITHAQALNEYWGSVEGSYENGAEL